MESRKIIPTKVSFYPPVKSEVKEVTGIDVKFVACVMTCYGNCPCCTVFDLYALNKFESFESLLAFALDNMNSLHIEKAICIDDDDKYEFKYGGVSKHSYHSIEVNKNGILIGLTRDNGSGKLYWDLNED